MLPLRSNPTLQTKGLVAENSRVPTKHAPNHLRGSMAGMETCSNVMGMRGGVALLCQVQ